MKPKALIFGWIFILAITLQACGGSPTAAPATPMTEEDRQVRLSTAVAGTLTAAAPAPTGTALSAATPTTTVEPTRQPGLLRVVYSRAGSIWVWTEGGQPKQLTNNIVDARPRLSDDGQWIVFERNNELYEVRPDGSDLKVLVSDAFLKPYLPSGYKFIWAEYFDWMPNSHFVYFTTKTGISGPETDVFQYDLFRANADSGEVKQLVAPGSGGVPYFGTDKKTIAMVQGKAIFLANIDGINLRKALSFEYVYTGGSWIYIPVAVPLPDGSGFRVLLPEHGPRGGPMTHLEFWELPITGEASLVYSNDSPGSFATFRNISLDGESFIYVNFLFRDDMSSQVCLHGNGKNPDDCWSSMDIGVFINWAPDSIHFVTEGKGEDGKLSYKLMDRLGNSIRINTAYSMYWIDMNRYVYVDKDLNLFLASINGDSIQIDKGVPPSFSKVDIWTWQFDFSN